MKYFIITLITVVSIVSFTQNKTWCDIDLTNAVVVVPESITKTHQAAVDMLIDEVEKRTQIRWKVGNAESREQASIYIANYDTAQNLLNVLSNPPEPAVKIAEEYFLSSRTSEFPRIFTYGFDDRGILYGVGRLLREMEMRTGSIAIKENLNIKSKPDYPIRGHQLGYRPKTNSYDAWDAAMWEQYIRDLAVFGCNAVELIPPRSDDDDTSPHFPLPQMEMMVKMSEILDKYDMDVWVWYPAIDPDYTTDAAIQKAVKEWEGVLSKLPRLDAVFIPGGDPGKTPPKILMHMLSKQHANLQNIHPGLEFWVSPQGFHYEWMDEFLGYLKTESPNWLSGLVFGPQNLISLPELRGRTPEQYQIRRYPDITHNIWCQYAVPDWDMAYMLTEHRESINPRPTDMANIFRLWGNLSDGFISYSEGCNDDVNKAIWSGLGWNEDEPVINILRQYARYFIGVDYEEAFAQGLLALELNWRGPLLTNGNVYTTLNQFQEMERHASPQTKLNWRFQMALYRAYYDAFNRARLIYETSLEEEAMSILRRADELGSAVAMQKAEDVLNRALTNRIAPDWRNRVFELAEALYQSIRMQKSVDKYQAIETWRGANLDLIDVSLNNREWLQTQFNGIHNLDEESKRLEAIHTITNWTNPGAGGFYDDLGNHTMQPHLTRGADYETDPEFRASSRIGFHNRSGYRTSWTRYAETRYGYPLEMQYKDLDSLAQYKVRVTYAGEFEYHGTVLVTMRADGKEIHPMMEKPQPIKPIEFTIPKELTQDGELVLQWNHNPERTGAGRGAQVAEVWLIRVE